MSDSSKVTQQVTRVQISWSQDMSSCRNLTVCFQMTRWRQQGRSGRRQNWRREGRGGTWRRRMAKPCSCEVWDGPSTSSLNPFSTVPLYPRGSHKMGSRLCGREGKPGNVFPEERAWPRGVAGLSKATCTLGRGAGTTEGPGQEEGPGLPLVPRNQSSQPWAFSSSHTEALLLARWREAERAYSPRFAFGG